MSGSNLGGATEVKFGGTLAKVLTDSEDEVEVETPAHPAGAVEVCVTTGGGTELQGGRVHVRRAAGREHALARPKERKRAEPT